MRVMVLRHAYAGEYFTKKEDLDVKDLSRKLKPEGVAAAKNLGQWMLDNDWVPNVIIASPIARAKQTASLIAGVIYGDSKLVKIDQNLTIQNPMEQVLVACARDEDCHRPLLVAHSDNLPRLRWLNGERPVDANDPFATCELRILKVNRDTFEWKEKFRVLPSEMLDAGDDYDNLGAQDLYGSAQR